MSIHVTPIPRLTAFAAPALTLGTANAAGVAETTIATDSTLLVFDTTVPEAVGASSAVGSATVVPRRDHVHAAITAPVFARVVRTSADITTTSTTLVDLTGATLTFTTGAFPVQYSVAQGTTNATTGAGVWFNVDLDGGLLHGTDGIPVYTSVGGYYAFNCFSGQTAALSAAEHTIKMQWKVGSSTGTVRGNTNSNFIWSVFEVR